MEQYLGLPAIKPESLARNQNHSPDIYIDNAMDDGCEDEKDQEWSAELKTEMPMPEEEGDTFACLKVKEEQDVDDGQAFGGPFQTTTMGTTTMATTMAPVNGAMAELNEDCIEVVFGDVTLPRMKPSARSGPSTAELTTILMQQAAVPEAPARDRAPSVTHSPRQPAAPGTTAHKQKPAKKNLDDDLFYKYLESEIKKNTLRCELFGLKKRINAFKERKLELEVAALEAAALEKQKKQPPGTM